MQTPDEDSESNSADDSEDDADDSSDGSEDDADDSSGDSSEESEKEVASKKRKAEEPVTNGAKKAKKADGDTEDTGVSNLFVGNLSWNVDEEWLTREFEEFGEISGCRIISDRDSGRSKG